MLVCALTSVIKFEAYCHLHPVFLIFSSETPLLQRISHRIREYWVCSNRLDISNGPIGTNANF